MDRVEDLSGRHGTRGKVSWLWLLLLGVIGVTAGDSFLNWAHAVLPEWSIGRYVIMFVNVGEEDEESAVIRIDNFGKDNYLYPRAWNNINYWWRVHLGDAGSGVMFVNTRVVPPAGSGTNGTGVNVNEIDIEEWHGAELYDQTIEDRRVVILGYILEAGDLPGGDGGEDGGEDMYVLTTLVAMIFGLMCYKLFSDSARRKGTEL